MREIKIEGLTGRQWALKRWLEANHVPGQFHSIEELVNSVLLPDGTPAYKLNSDPRVHDKCVTLSADVRAIDWNQVEGYKIIIKDTRGGIKLCETEDEFETWYQNEMKPVVRKFQYLNNLKFKIQRDGMMPLMTQSGRVIDTEKEQLKVVEAYQN